MRMIVLTCEIVTFSIRPRNSGARPTVPGKRMESTFCGFDPGDQPIDLEEATISSAPQKKRFNRRRLSYALLPNLQWINPMNGYSHTHTYIHICCIRITQY